METKVLKALGDPKRFELLQLMSERGYCVRALAHQSGLSESAVSQHMKILREAGLVIGVKRGYYVHYRVDRDALGAVIDELAMMRDMQRKPCQGAFRGCPAAEYVRCSGYVAQEKKEE